MASDNTLEDFWEDLRHKRPALGVALQRTVIDAARAKALRDFFGQSSLSEEVPEWLSFDINGILDNFIQHLEDEYRSLGPAGVPLSPPSKYNFSKGSLWMPRVDYPPGLWLRKRSVEECLRIEAAAHKMLRSLRNSSWDRLAEDDDTSSIVPAVVTCPKSCAPEM